MGGLTGLRLLLPLLATLAGCDIVFGLERPAKPPPEWTQLAGGYGQTCGIRNDKTLWCWGDNAYGQTGMSPDTVEVLVPTQIGNGTWLAVATGVSHTCAIDVDHSLWCWGSNSLGEGGTGTTDATLPPTRVLDDVISVAAGNLHTCAVQGSSALWCWGYNLYGELGVTTPTTVNRLPILVADQGFASVTTTNVHTCALTVDGKAFCWGYNNSGQLIPGGATTYPTPQPIEPDHGWLVLSAGDYHTCGLRDDGALRCWGNDAFGELGGASSGGAVVTVAPTDPATAWTSVVAGSWRTCALRDDATLWCWGRNDQGQLAQADGDGTKPRPVQIVDGATSWTGVALGWMHTCATDSDGAAWCVGDDGTGQLGTGLGGSRSTPTRVDGTWSDVKVGAASVCARDQGGAVQCWGQNSHSELGDGSSFSRQRPSFVMMGTVGAALTFGATHACATDVGTTASKLTCWGDNRQGAVADPAPADQFITSPKRVPLVMQIREVHAGTNFTCAIGFPGTMWCWGTNDLGQLGSPRSATPNPVPTVVSNTWLSGTTGTSHVCGLDTMNRIYCWGDNTSGQLGVVTAGNATVQVLGVWRSVHAGARHTCALDNGDRLYCWGEGRAGQIGDGQSSSQPVPVPIGATSQKTVELGDAHTCALDMLGGLSCWGDNSRGQLGLPDRSKHLVPMRIGTDSDWTNISAGGSETCAIKADHSLWCWGANQFGQLGDGSAWSPVMVRVTVP